MATGRDLKLTGAVGEFRVAAELCRRGHLATPFSGNVPHYDIIASGQSGDHVAIQVKAINRGAWQFDAKRFFQISFKKTPLGVGQLLGRAVPEPYAGLLFVLVLLSVDGNDRFFILSYRQLRKVIIQHYQAYLDRFKGVRPRSARSTHVSVSVEEVARYEDGWDLVKTALR